METKDKQLAQGEKTRVDWWTWLKKEFTVDKQLIPIKAVTFFFNGGVVAFVPYLVLHMQQLGITVEEIATMYAVLPLASLIGPPITGLVADKFGRYGFMFNINIILTGLFHTLLLHVPPVPTNNINLLCDSRGHSLNWASCDDCYQIRNNTETTVQLQNCYYTCQNPNENVTMCYSSSVTNVSRCFNYGLSEMVSINGTLRSWAKQTCSHTWSTVSLEGEVFDSMKCPESCSIVCDVTGVERCHELLNVGSNRTFWVYFGLRLLATFFLSSAFIMLDATTLAEIKRHKGEFGKQRVLTMLGYSIIPLIAAIIIDNTTGPAGEADYMSAFYLGDAMLAISVILIARLDIEVDLPQDNIAKGLKQIITRPEIDVFLLLILILGSNFGFIESYLFVFLKELEAPNYLLGLTMTVGCLTSIPMLFWADSIVGWMGRHNVFLISFVAYAVRMFGYSYIKNPWFCFPFEALEVFTYQLMWVAAATYCPILAPKGLLATMTGVAGAVHYSFGKGLGALLGGYLIAAVNTSNAFKIYGVIALFGGVVYFSSYHCYLKNLIKSKEKQLVVKKLGDDADEGDTMMDYETKIRIDIANNVCRRPSTFSWTEERRPSNFSWTEDVHRGDTANRHEET